MRNFNSMLKILMSLKLLNCEALIVVPEGPNGSIHKKIYILLLENLITIALFIFKKIKFFISLPRFLLTQFVLPS